MNKEKMSTFSRVDRALVALAFPSGKHRPANSKAYFSALEICRERMEQLRADSWRVTIKLTHFSPR